MNTLLAWYASLDSETVDLFKRFVAKTMSMQNKNEYLKKVLRKELDNVVEP